MASKKILYAYCEDALSTELGNESKADQELAGRVLRSLADVDGLLASIRSAAETAKTQDAVPPTPNELFDQATKNRISGKNDASGVAETVKEKLTQKRQLEELDVTGDPRCFVGGNYFDGHNLTDIIDIVRAARHDAIFVYDFQVPSDQVHDLSLRLLSRCSTAIFEVTSPAGQLMELERCTDYNITPLILRQTMEGRTDIQASQMIHSMSGVDVTFYTRVSELTSLIRTYLTDSL